MEVVARCDSRGRTVLPVVRASGQLAVRRTGPTSVHLVATAFGPLGGDDAEITLVVEEGAALTVHSVAAAVALPARDGDAASVQRVHATVAGALTLAPEPTVVTARAHHRAELLAELADGARLTATEQVLLGRAGEEPGRWTGTMRVVRAGHPLLHTTISLGPGAPAWLPPVAPRAYAATLSLGTTLPVATGQDAVRLPLDDGWSATAWGTELHSVVRSLEALCGADEEVA